MKYFLFFILFFKITYAENLSTYYEVSIENFNSKLDKSYYINKIINNLTDANISSSKINPYMRNFYYNNINQTYNFEINIIDLSELLIEEGAIFNLNALSCSLAENFFVLNSENYNDCPKFYLKNNSEMQFLYIENSDKSFRVKKINNIYSLKKIWLELFPISEYFARDYKIKLNKYQRFTSIISNYPRIKLYENNYVHFNLKYFYSNEEINFILNFL